jgi:hypothetical protein
MDGNQTDQSPRIREILQRSAPPGDNGAELVKYVLVELDVSRDNHQKFQEMMPDLVELMFDHKRWELVFASYPITGRVNRFVHIWRIPDESTIVEVMRDGAVDLGRAQLPKEGTLDALFRACYMSVQSLVERTSHTLMTSLPYDPTHVGFQSQTILIDAESEAFLIDHGKLRFAAESRRVLGLTDVAEVLEDVRRVKFTRVSRAKEPLPKDGTAVERVKALGPERVKALMELQKHLNRGSAVARLKFEGEHALLFNLAGLKAKSVFQAVQPLEAAKEPKLGTLAFAGDGEVDVPVLRLLIAMPWGGVYDVNAKALQQLAQPIPADRNQATAQALEPIRAGLAPIAAIPAEREDVIGDGCACFVINLNSFVTASGRARLPRRAMKE